MSRLNTRKIKHDASAVDNITLDANGRVGIGTSSPSKKLHIVSDEWNNTSGSGVIFENSNNVGAGITLKPSASSNPNGWSLYAGASGANIGNGSIGFWDHDASSERWYLDATGAMHIPDQPGCMVYCQGSDINWTAGNNILYGANSNTTTPSIVAWDTTNSFNYSNSSYTAPVAGKYYLSFTANGVYTGTVPRAYPRVNGGDLGRGQHIRGNSSISGDLDQRTYAGIIALQANDVVTVYVGAGTWDTFGANYFCIYKIS